MDLDRMRHGWRGCGPWERLAVVVWVAVLLAITARGYLWPRVHSVYPIYAAAAQRWLAGEDLYRPVPGYDYYRYSPLVAVCFVPFNALPDALGGVLWRGLNAGLYLGALGWWARTVLPFDLTRSQRAVLFLLVVPLSLASLNNAQSNALVLGLLLAAMAAIVPPHPTLSLSGEEGDNVFTLSPSGGEGRVRGRWNLAAACIALACCFKLYPVAVGLLLAAVYPRRLAPRMAVALTVGLLLPFAFQRPGYVLAQYAGWVDHLLTYDRHTNGVSLWYRDVSLLARGWRVPLSGPGYLMVQLLAATAIAALCLAARAAAWPPRRLLPLLLGLGCCWMTAFGPATESCTYILLAPALAAALLHTWQEPQPRWVMGLLLASQTLLLLAQVACWFPFGRAFRDLGPQPFAALLFLACLAAAALRDMLRPVSAAPSPSPLPHPMGERAAMFLPSPPRGERVG